MIETSFHFLRSTIPLYHNAIKSIIFKAAELFMALFVYKVFCLVAAGSHYFTSYLMFAEDYVQRALFISSRGISRAGLLVAVFSVVQLLASLYGTMLWALDSPGYIFRATEATAADYSDQRSQYPPYIVELRLDRDLEQANATLEQTIGAGLFNPGLNYTLTGNVHVEGRGGAPEVVAASESRTGPRIWLDSDGFSVSNDNYVMIPSASTNNDTGHEEKFNGSCIHYADRVAAWNCTFGNGFALELLSTVVGRPEVHWDIHSDKLQDSRYISPNHVDNIWTSFGAGGGSALMQQVFTVTKEKRRHTFVESTLKVTMLTSPGVPFAPSEVKNLVQRTWSPDETTWSDPIIGLIVDDMMAAQAKDASYQYGLSATAANNLSVAQSNWGLYTPESGGLDVYSLISIRTSNITLIRSETLDEAPTPFEKCSRGSFQNEAFGGKLTQTDCLASKVDNSKSGFFGQVDTAAVLITNGLGDSRSNLSSESLTETSLDFIWNRSARLSELLTARAFTVGVDPALVAVSVDELMVAMSDLQLFLSCLAVALAIVAWLVLGIFADAHWSNSLMANLVHSMSEGPGQKAKPGYMTRPPRFGLGKEAGKTVMNIEGQRVGSRPTAMAAVPLLPHGPQYRPAPGQVQGVLPQMGKEQIMTQATPTGPPGYHYRS